MPDEELRLVDGELFRVFGCTNPECEILSATCPVESAGGLEFMCVPEARLHDQRRLPHQYSPDLQL